MAQRQITIDINDLLDLVTCAADYGFGRDVFYSSMAKWLGTLSDAEIEARASAYLLLDGYTDEDVSDTRARLIQFRDDYLAAAPARR